MKFAYLAGAGLAILGSSSNAQAPSGETLLAICSRETSKLDICNTYLKGFASGNQMAGLLRKEGHSICVPEKSTTDQIRDVVTAFIKAHPEASKLDGNSVIAVALASTFPCQEQK